MKIIGQVRATAAMIRAARKAYARSAFAPLAGSPDILAPRIGQEDVCATVSTLRSSLEPSSSGGKWFKIHVIGNGDHQIYVLDIDLVGRHGADESDSKYTGKSTCCLYKATGLQQEEMAQWLRSACDAAHGELVDNDA